MAENIEIRSLQDVSTERLHQAFMVAFSDYVEPVSFSMRQLGRMLARRAYHGGISFGAFLHDEMVGFTLNGLDEWEGVVTAYDTGTGVRPEYRGMGIATRIFDASLPLFREQGIERYLLEVIRTNTGAVTLYRKLGFRLTREFDYWSCSPELTLALGSRLPPGMSVNVIQSLDWDALCSFWDYAPSWQNSIGSIERARKRCLFLGVFSSGKVVAYAVMERGTGDVPQFAVHPSFRRMGLASILLRELTERIEPPELRFTNTDAAYAPIRAFLLGIGLQPGDGQYEMMLNL